MTKNTGRKTVSYTEAQATKWLAWLARGMQRHGQTIFQIEQLQPSWLQGRGELLLYLLSTRIIWGVIVGLIFGLIFGLVGGLETLGWMLGGGLVVGLSVGLLAGLIAGIIDFWRYRRPSPIINWKSRYKTLQMLLGLVSGGLIFGLILGLVLGLFHGLDGLGGGLIVGLIFGPLFGLFWMQRSVWRSLNRSIQPVEILRWAWHSSRDAGCKGLIFGLIFGLFGTLLFGLAVEFGTLGWRLASGLIFGLFGGLVFGVLGSLLGGFTPGIREMKTAPNQGIRLSLRYAVQVWVTSGIIVGLLVGLLFKNPGIGLTYGLLAGLGFGMWFGGLEVVDHSILRAIMVTRGYAPFNFARFLDYAAKELHFLQKVGGGYMFVHRYLLEYFAVLEDSNEIETSRPQSQSLNLE